MRIPPKDPAGMEQEILRNFAVPYAENTGSLPLLEKCLRGGLPVAGRRAGTFREAAGCP